MENKNKKIIIIGGGLTGLSLGYHLNKKKHNNFIVFEKASEVGGLCKSEKIDGFTFDYTGHLLHSRTSYVGSLINKLLKNNVVEIKRSAWIYINDRLIPYPFQVNLFGLPSTIVKECLLGFIKAAYANEDKMPLKTYEDWIRRNFGDGIAKYFMIPYNHKLWTVPLNDLAYNGANKYVPTLSLSEIIDGALGIKNNDFGYNVYFKYPIYGGIGSIANALADFIKDHIQLGAEVIGVDLKKKIVQLKNEDEISYDYLVSSAPLPEFISSLKNLPSKIKKLNKELKNTSVYCGSFGIKSKETSGKHWIYFPEKDFVFYRVGFQSNFSSEVGPRNTTSIYAEVSFSDKKKVNKDKILDLIYADLIKAKIIKKEDKVLTKKLLCLKYAYVRQDKNYKNATKHIHEYLNKQNIYSIGRFGKWEYSAMEDAILEGKEIAEKISNNTK
jgi:UDP-galactopyranose mutase